MQDFAELSHRSELERSRQEDVRKNCIKVGNLPLRYNPREILDMFDKVSRIQQYTLFPDEVWIRFRNIEDRYVCCFLDGVQVGDRKITVNADFPETDLARMKQSSPNIDALYFNRESVRKVRLEKSRRDIHQQADAACRDYSVDLMRYVFSSRFFNLLLLLYLLWKAIELFFYD